MSAEAFLEWNARQDEPFELVHGMPVRMMAGAKQSHNVVVGNLVGMVITGAKRAGCRTTSSDTAVVTGSGGVRYPDVVVDCGPPDPDAMAASRPTIVIEVLSRTTSQIDFSDKLDEYKSNVSIEIILLVDPDIVSVKLYRRIGDHDWMAERYHDLEMSIDLPSITTTLALRDIYDTLDPRMRPSFEVVGRIGGDS